MKKKIIFMLINMNVGGTEKALLNMIDELPKEKFDITILLLENYGGFRDSIPHYVNVECLQGYNQIKNIINEPLHIIAFNFLKSGRLIKSLTFMYFYLITKITNERSQLFKYVLKDFQLDKNDYDIAVAYAGPMDFISYFVLHKIKAKKKIQWIHFDITKIGFNKSFAKKIYKKFEQVHVVSSEAKSKLIKVLPSIALKTDVFLNVVSPRTIFNQAKKGQGFKDEYNGLRILTVGRLAQEKGQDLAILALKKLIKDGFDVKWYCLGDGNMRREYEKLSSNNNLEDKFIFLGANPNPYPYLEQCDIYVQPSRYEGYCLTILEAKYFNKPIIATNVNGVREQVKDGETGIIVNIDENQIYLALKKLIKNKDLRNKLTCNLVKENKQQYDSLSFNFK
jgi:glycosyltransferase involved in cell wall biosynthesis